MEIEGIGDNEDDDELVQICRWCGPPSGNEALAGENRRGRDAARRSSWQRAERKRRSPQRGSRNAITGSSPRPYLSLFELCRCCRKRRRVWYIYLFRELVSHLSGRELVSHPSCKDPAHVA
jgi:hypothetical protein